MTQATAERTKLAEVRTADCIPTPDNPRRIDVTGEAFQELVDSVRGQGVLVPVHVRAHPKRKGKWDLRAGERRLRAAQAAGLETIPAIVHDAMTDAEAFELTFTENFAREDLTHDGFSAFIRRSHGIEQLAALVVGGGVLPKMGERHLTRRVGKFLSRIKQRFQ